MDPTILTNFPAGRKKLPKRHMKALKADLKKSSGAYFLLLPIFLGLFIFCYYPPINGLYRAFFDWNPLGRSEWV